MTNQRHVVRAAVYVVIKKGDEVLMLRRHKTSYRDGEYTLPAGHVEAGETLIETCIRESAEEVCLDIKPEDLHLVHVMQRHENGVDVIDHYFQAEKWVGKPRIGEPHKADDLQWVSPRVAKSNAIHFVNTALDHIAANKIFSHNGIEVAAGAKSDT